VFSELRTLGSRAICGNSFLQAADQVSEAFNPYREWLGLEADVEAPHFYQLLDVELFEADRAKLMTAADKALVRVRGFRPGPHAAAWAKLLDELAQAKACFQDPARKSLYDNNLRETRQRQLPAQPPCDITPQIAAMNQSPDLYPPGMAPKTPTIANESSVTVSPTRNPYPPGMARVLEGIPAAPSPWARPHPSPPPTRADSRSDVPAARTTSDVSAVREPVPPGPVNAHVAPPRLPPTSLVPLAAAVAGALIVVTLIILFIALRDNAGGSAPVPPGPLPSPAAGAPAQAHPARDSAPATARSVPDTKVIPAPGDSSPTTEPSHDTPDSPPDAPTSSPPAGLPPSPSASDTQPAAQAELAELGKALQQARSAIADHQFRVADRVLEKAATLATSAEHQAMVARLRHLGQRAEQFWNVVAAAARGLSAAEELKIGASDLIVVVVETARDSITIRNQGRNVKYSLTDMPPGLALAIARRAVNENDAQTLILFGACVATVKDLKPMHVDEARRYWEQAKERGADVNDLLAALTDKYE
jgi:hypothetical protein